MGPKNTLWPLEPHTRGKHLVLKHYLDAWFPILGSWSGRILFIDGFAGPGARPMRVEWARHILRQCKNQNVPFFFKQWGGVQKGRTGRVLDGKTWDEMPVTLNTKQLSLA